MNLQTAQRMLDKWIEAEEKVMSGQSYSMGSRSLTHANLNEIGNRIKFYQREVGKLKNRGRSRVRYVVPK
ncbi:MAG: DUF6148 family protein [Tissierellales bacterium]|nr:DUF6148 family protein [Tissierellales bacterium]